MREQENDQSLVAVQVLTHRYETLALKDFRAVIPAHLLAKLPEDERFLVETVSKLESQFDWAMTGLLKANHDVLDLHSRVSALEMEGSKPAVRFEKEQRLINEQIFAKLNTLWDWKQFFSGKWAIIAGLALLIVGGLTKFLFDIIGKLFKP